MDCACHLLLFLLFRAGKFPVVRFGSGGPFFCFFCPATRNVFWPCIGHDLVQDLSDVMGLRALQPSAAIVKVMSVPDSRCIRVVTPDDHVNIGFHEVLLHDMEGEDLPFVALSELNCLPQVWPKTLYVFMSRYQHDLERMRKECKERFGCTQLGNCTHCGKYIQHNLGKHIALYHMELAQLWRCPVTWCTVWKGTAQDCVDHLRRTHDVPQIVKAANLARYFPPWTVTRGQWSEMTRPSISGVVIDTLIFSRIGVPLFHRYRIISRTGTRMQNRFVDNIAGAPGSWRHACRSHQVGSQQTERRMFLLDAQSLVGQSPWSGDLASQCGGGGLGLLRPRKRFPYLSRKRPLCKLSWTWHFIALQGWVTGLLKYTGHGHIG